MDAIRRNLGAAIEAKGAAPSSLSRTVTNGKSGTLIKEIMEKNQDIKLSTISRLAEALGVPVEDILPSRPTFWSPSEATILELLAAAMLVDEADHERRDLLQDVANKAQTVLSRIAEKPEYEADQSRIAGMFETVRAAAASLPISPEPQKKRTPNRR